MSPFFPLRLMCRSLFQFLCSLDAGSRPHHTHFSTQSNSARTEFQRYYRQQGRDREWARVIVGFPWHYLWLTVTSRSPSSALNLRSSFFRFSSSLFRCVLIIRLYRYNENHLLTQWRSDCIYHASVNNDVFCLAGQSNYAIKGDLA